MESVDKKSIEIKVQFEYLNNNDTLVLSKEYKVKIFLVWSISGHASFFPLGQNLAKWDFKIYDRNTTGH